MPYIINNTHSNAAEIFYVDYGSGQPIILIHGWPLSHRSWDGQIPALVKAGYRVIAYDRRGFGKSSAPWQGYNYSTLASDVRELIIQLKLDDVALCGFSMGGGEVVRYFTDFGGENISKAILINSIIPLVKKTENNPAGVPQDVLNEILEAVENNRVTFLENFHKNFYNYSEENETVSKQDLHYDWLVASQASARATLKTAEAWANTDFREELKNVQVPTLILHGNDDNIVPIDTAGRAAVKGIKNSRLIEIAGAPHGMNLTHREEINKHIIQFLDR